MKPRKRKRKSHKDRNIIDKKNKEKCKREDRNKMR